MSKTHKLTNETFSPENFRFVDLGLPSGRLWATENAPGFYTFDEAVDTFGELLPKGSAMVELIEESEVSLNREKKGLDITGPNGNTIFLPADGFSWEMKVNNAKLEGDYWTRMPFSQTLARCLYFNSGGVRPFYDYTRCLGFSVRPCKEP